jgi:hypothetical protein
MTLATRHIAPFAASLGMWTLVAGCQTTESYARVWGERDVSEPGVESLSDAHERYATTSSERARLWGKEDAEELAQCEMLRHQLVHASEAATFQVGMLWGCPFVWPLDLVTLLVWPVTETQRAQSIWSAATRLERAYQTDVPTFRTVCRQVRSTDVGRTFLQVQRAQLRAAAHRAAAQATDDEPGEDAQDEAVDSAADSASANDAAGEGSGESTGENTRESTGASTPEGSADPS